MSDPRYQPWSDSPTAPRITKYEYTAEKAMFAGSFIGTTLYGTSIRAFDYSRSLRFFGLL